MSTYDNETKIDPDLKPAAPQESQTSRLNTLSEIDSYKLCNKCTKFCLFYKMCTIISPFLPISISRAGFIEVFYIFRVIFIKNVQFQRDCFSPS